MCQMLTFSFRTAVVYHCCIAFQSHTVEDFNPSNSHSSNTFSIQVKYVCPALTLWGGRGNFNQSIRMRQLDLTLGNDGLIDRLSVRYLIFCMFIYF